MADVKADRGSLGSLFWKAGLPPALAFRVAEDLDWNRLGRRGGVTSDSGAAVWMEPSALHGKVLRSVTEAVIRTARDRGIRIRRMEAPDGKAACHWDAAFHAGQVTGRGGHPPDLAVIVEQGPDFPHSVLEAWTAAGVNEAWIVDQESDGMDVRMLLLRLGQPPADIPRSRIFPGMEDRDIAGMLAEMAEAGPRAAPDTDMKGP